MLAIRTALTAGTLALTTATGYTATSCAPPASTTSAPATQSTSKTAATVVALDYTRRAEHPITGIYHAECRDTAGNTWLVTITAAQNNKLHQGDPCPPGKHLPMPQDAHPDIWSALNEDLPYHGGDPHGPCGEWSADNQQHADEMRREYDKCMAKNNGK